MKKKKELSSQPIRLQVWLTGLKLLRNRMDAAQLKISLHTVLLIIKGNTVGVLWRNLVTTLLAKMFISLVIEQTNIVGFLIRCGFTIFTAQKIHNQL